MRKHRPKEFGVFSEFYFPLIVLEGCLFEASVTGAEIDLHQRSHLQLRIWRSLHDLTVIDVVTRDYFQEFFNGLEHSHNELVAAIKSLKFPPEFRAAVLAKKKTELDFHASGAVAIMMMHDAKQRRKKAKESKK